jgi:hypothetical protein
MLVLGATSALAAPGRSTVENDEPFTPIVISKIPNRNTQNTLQATTGFDPTPSCMPRQLGSTVWYQFTPTTDTIVRATTFGSNYDTVLVVYDGITEVGCDDDTRGPQSRVLFFAPAGTTYDIMIGAFPGTLGGKLTFNVQSAP